jgi:two-component system KDP operon response regulator KdpE
VARRRSTASRRAARTGTISAGPLEWEGALTGGRPLQSPAASTSVGAMAVQRRRVLLADDEPRIRDSVRMNLEIEGFDVFEAGNGVEALDKVRLVMPDVVVLDVMMPEMDGFETLRELRRFSTVPVIMLTVKADERDVARGLELGADDYVAKPFSQMVLTARIKAVLRRAELPPLAPRQSIQVDDRLSIDFERREVTVDGQKVQLRPTEFRLLYHLASNPGVVLSHETLLSRVWGPEYRDASHYLRLYVNYLRQKIEQDPSNPRYILTERGVGYRFVDYTRDR